MTLHRITLYLLIVGLVGFRAQAEDHTLLVVSGGTHFPGDLMSGVSGTNNVVEVQGAVAVPQAAVGWESGADANRLYLMATGAVVAVDRRLYVGYQGGENHAEVRSGVTLLTGASIIGDEDGADSNRIDVASGSVWSNRLDVSVGRGGDANRLEVSGQMVTLRTRIGAGRGDRNEFNLLPGGRATHGLSITVGERSAANCLTVSEGATLETRHLLVGVRHGADFNEVVLTGGEIESKQQTTVGVSSTGNLLDVSGAADLKMGRVVVGLGEGASQNLWRIRGMNTTVETDAFVEAGRLGHGNRIEITEGAAPSFSGLLVGSYYGGESNRCVIADAGLHVDSYVHVRRGVLQMVSNAVLNAQGILVEPVSQVVLEDSQITGSITNGGHMTLSGTVETEGVFCLGSGVLEIETGTIWRVHGTLELEDPSRVTGLLRSRQQIETGRNLHVVSHAEDRGASLSGFHQNAALGHVDLEGSMSMEGSAYVWKLTGDGNIDVPSGETLYVFDRTDWTGQVTGRGTLEQIVPVIEHLDLFSNRPRLSWPTAQGFTVEVQRKLPSGDWGTMTNKVGSGVVDEWTAPPGSAADREIFRILFLP